MEVADGVLQGRYDPFDVTVGVVRGEDGLLLVDTRSSAREARRLLEDLVVFAVPVRAVVLTHAHFDHSFGTHRVLASTGPVPVYGHERLAGHLDAYERPDLERWVRDGDGPVPGLGEVRLVEPDQVVVDEHRVLLGDREVRLWHPGRGHTDHDLVVHVPAAGCWLVGDLVEESGPPSVGADSDLRAWPATLGRLLGRIGDGDVVIPGHGAAVDRTFVEQQRSHLRERAAGPRTPGEGVGSQDAGTWDARRQDVGGQDVGTSST
ncbi:MBL fold metallo-hydrolase [Thalassiella azotivora]